MCPARNSTHPSSKKRSAVRTMKKQGWTIEEIAKRTGLSQTEVELILEIPDDL